MVNNVVIACVVAVLITLISYFIHNKCYDEENDKKTMVKLSLLSLVLTGVTYYFTNSGSESTPALSNQDVLTGEPGF
tara:strand:+ start:490 stop:720 length:231 start_codon:yes stop_codon:yes gene_type:complete